MGIAGRFEVYIFYKSSGSCFMSFHVPKSSQMATVGVMLILSDAFLSLAVH